jgi:hypothetical protein
MHTIELQDKTVLLYAIPEGRDMVDELSDQPLLRNYKVIGTLSECLADEDKAKQVVETEMKVYFKDYLEYYLCNSPEKSLNSLIKAFKVDTSTNYAVLVKSK